MTEIIIEQKRYSPLEVIPNQYPPIPGMLPNISIYQRYQEITVERASLPELIKVLQQIQEEL